MDSAGKKTGGVDARAAGVIHVINVNHRMERLIDFPFAEDAHVWLNFARLRVAHVVPGDRVRDVSSKVVNSFLEVCSVRNDVVYRQTAAELDAGKVDEGDLSPADRAARESVMQTGRAEARRMDDKTAATTVAGVNDGCSFVAVNRGRVILVDGDRDTGRGVAERGATGIHAYTTQGVAEGRVNSEEAGSLLIAADEFAVFTASGKEA